MIASFFQSLETSRVAYLLISGQATVLYGAATFSEDIDLWVEPSAANIGRLRAVLSAVGARYYKLTPPLTLRLLEETTPDVATLSWAAHNLFTTETFFFFNETYPQWAKVALDLPSFVREIAGRAADDLSDEIVTEAAQWMANSIAHHQLRIAATGARSSSNCAICGAAAD